MVRKNKSHAGVDAGSSLIKLCWRDKKKYQFASDADPQPSLGPVSVLRSAGIKQVNMVGAGCVPVMFEPNFNVRQLGADDPIGTEIRLQAEGVKRLFAMDGLVLTDFLLVSIGTGTSFTRVTIDGVRPFRLGTGMGGGSMWRRLMLGGVPSPRCIEGLAVEGKVRDMFVRDKFPALAGSHMGDFVLSHYGNAELPMSLMDLCATELHETAVLIVRDLVEPPAGMTRPEQVVFTGTAVTRLPTFRNFLFTYATRIGELTGIPLTPMWHVLGEYALAIGAYHAA